MPPIRSKRYILNSRYTLSIGSCLQATYNLAQDVLLHVTQVMFPMYKAFTEPDIASAKVRIHSTYNPMVNMADPIFSCKVRKDRNESSLLLLAWFSFYVQSKLDDVTWDYQKFINALPKLALSTQDNQARLPTAERVVIIMERTDNQREFKDYFLNVLPVLIYIFSKLSRLPRRWWKTSLICTSTHQNTTATANIRW